MVTKIFICHLKVYKKQICDRLGFAARKTVFHRVKGYVSCDET